MSVEIDKAPESLRDKRIVVTGGSGFLGQHLVKALEKLEPRTILVPRSKENDLRVYESCLEVCKGNDIIFHLAADVGGIGYNQRHPYELAFNNLMISSYMVNAAIESGVKKFIGIGTVCEYPKFAPTPFKEEELWNGYPEETNAPYGLAKKMLLVLSQAARQEYDLNALHIMPVNLYGPGDNFDPESSHVIPALIKRVADAKKDGIQSITVWGTGNATREFLYVEDAAWGVILAALHYNSGDPVNLGSGTEISVHELVNLIVDIVGYKGKVKWDTSKPEGQPRRRLDVSKAKREFNFEAQVPFREGLVKTIEWYLINHSS